MSNKRTRQRQLQKQAQRRAAERRRHRRNRIIAGVTAGAVALGGLGFAAAAFLTGDEENPAASSSPSPNQTGPPSPATQAAACNAKAPAAAEEEKPMFDKPPQMQIDPSKDYTAVMKTSCGTIELRLYADQTPVTVNSFVFLAEQGFFDGLTFHRIIPDFVLQGGDPEGTGSGGPGYQFEDEIVKSLKFDRPGLLAMANSGPDTNGSQFFITTGEPKHLNGMHTIFGEVTDGMKVVKEIESFGTSAGTPSETVYIEKVTIKSG
jgi:peptidyl-prolyl cis-trans isomerase B (cyclophilin B)